MAHAVALHSPTHGRLSLIARTPRRTPEHLLSFAAQVLVHSLGFGAGHADWKPQPPMRLDHELPCRTTAISWMRLPPAPGNPTRICGGADTKILVWSLNGAASSSMMM